MVAEMGHKEVGGVKAKLDEFGHEAVVLEQLEIDWKFCNNPLQTADNELQARIIVREVFRENGLDVPLMLNQLSALLVLVNILTFV